MESSVVINQVIILFFVIIVGVYARKRNIISADMTKKMSDLLLQVTQPLLIISSFQFEFSEEMLRNAALVLLMSLVIHLFSMLVARFIYIRYPERTRSVLKYITVFSNCGFMGFPVLESVFGSVGVFYGALYVIPFNVLALSYGVMVFTGKSDKDTIKKILSHPVIISVAVGMVLWTLLWIKNKASIQFQLTDWEPYLIYIGYTTPFIYRYISSWHILPIFSWIPAIILFFSIPTGE
jgi:predicted permease